MSLLPIGLALVIGCIGGIIIGYTLGIMKQRSGASAKEDSGRESAQTSGVRIYVGNLSYEVTEADVKEIFKPFGTVTEVTVNRDNRTGRSRGFGFVEMSSPAETKRAIHSLNDKKVHGRRLKVGEANERGKGRRPRKKHFRVQARY